MKKQNKSPVVVSSEVSFNSNHFNENGNVQHTPIPSHKRASHLDSESARKKRKSRLTDVFMDAETGSVASFESGLNDPFTSTPNQRVGEASTEDLWHDAYTTPVSNNNSKIMSSASVASPSFNLNGPQSSCVMSDVDDPVFEAISLYQAKVIELQKNQIDLLTKLAQKSNIDSFTAAQLASLQSEIDRYQMCIDPLQTKAAAGRSVRLSQTHRLVPQKNETDYAGHEEVEAEFSAANMESEKSHSLLFIGTKPADHHEPVSSPSIQPIVPPHSAEDGIFSQPEISIVQPPSPSPNNASTPHLDGPVGSANAPLEFDSDEDFGEISDSEFHHDPLPTTFPENEIEVVSSDDDMETEVYELLSDIEEAESIKVTDSPQGVRMPEAFAPSATSGKLYPWSVDVNRVLRDVFKLSQFRCNQLEAINGTLTGKDVFVLMPTGGGKSLCYQLPALIDSGSTAGSTVVVSPLISLMQDQTFHLKRKGIKAEMLSSKLSRPERAQVFSDFLSGEIRLLYVSPEMLNASNQLRNSLTKMMQRNRLARIVIDEAHCVSSWGHDFRPDYKLLENLQNDFPRVPIMALTATANERVRLDILKCLRGGNVIFLKQSFNRENLFYAVQEKGKDVIGQISELMKGKFKGKSGIIYCHSRVSCERTAVTLDQAGLRAAFYHGSMTHEEREQVQEAWQGGRILVICATIAFGMGIDKPDVRFVFHLTLPRNMEGYYQETGRAGRDGLQSECILFYHFKDALTLQSMINKDDLSPQIKANHKDMLKRVVQYCQNTTDCRRKQVLQYFNEVFDVRHCRSGCDNCRNGQNSLQEIRDVTERAKEVVQLVQSIQQDNVALGHCIDVYRGSRIKKIMEKGHDRAASYGLGKSLDRTEVERMFHHFMTEGILDEYSVYSSIGFSTSYIKRGPAGTRLLSGKLKVTMAFAAPVEKGTADAADATATETTKVKAKNGTAAAKATPKTKAAPKATPKATPKAASKTKTPKATSAASATPKATPVRKPAAKSAVSAAPVVAATSPFFAGAADPAWTFQENCYGKLEVKRLQLKKDFNLAQVTEVCSNAALTNMAKVLPTDLESFSSIKGITQNQVENFYVYFRPELIKLSEQKQQAGIQGRL